MRDATPFNAKAFVLCPPPHEVPGPLPLRRQASFGAGLPAPLAAVFLCWMAVGSLSTCRADPTVIYDSGRTTSIAPFLQAISPPTEPRVAKIAPPPFAPPAMIFPVRSSSLTPGRLPIARRVELRTAIPNPVILIGSDDFSKQWLRRHRDRLARIGATGLVVNVSNLEAFRHLQSLALGVPLAPASGEDLAKLLKLTHYPVLIQTTGEVSQ